MQKKVILLLAAFVILLLPLQVLANTGEVSLAELVESAGEYDGKTVAVRGEALGEVMERGENAWINITDTTNAMGVWLKLDDAKTISYFGDYRHKGDIVRITGTFHKACKEHNGELDIHAGSIQIVARGSTLKEEISSYKIYAAVILLSLFLVTLCFFAFKMKKLN